MAAAGRACGEARRAALRGERRSQNSASRPGAGLPTARASSAGQDERPAGRGRSGGADAALRSVRGHGSACERHVGKENTALCEKKYRVAGGRGVSFVFFRVGSQDVGFTCGMDLCTFSPSLGKISRLVRFDGEEVWCSARQKFWVRRKSKRRLEKSALEKRDRIRSETLPAKISRAPRGGARDKAALQRGPCATLCGRLPGFFGFTYRSTHCPPKETKHTEDGELLRRREITQFFPSHEKFHTVVFK